MFSYENLCVQDLDYAHIIDFSSCEKMNEHGYATVTIEIDEGKQDEMETVCRGPAGSGGFLAEHQLCNRNAAWFRNLPAGSGKTLLFLSKQAEISFAP